VFAVPSLNLKGRFAKSRNLHSHLDTNILFQVLQHNSSVETLLLAQTERHKHFYVPLAEISISPITGNDRLGAHRTFGCRFEWM